MNVPDPPGQRRRWLAAGLAVGVIGLLIRLWLFQQPINSDDVQYYSQAVNAPGLDELASARSPNSMRVVFLAVPALVHRVFDSAFYSFYVSVYLLAALSFASLFAFSWILAGPRVAVFTAAVWSTSFVSVSADTRLTPDNFGVSLAMIGLALIAWAGLPPPSPDGAPHRGGEPRRSTLAPVIAAAAGGGFVLWLSIAARESFVVFGMVGLLFAVLSRRRWLVTTAVVGGLLVGFALECLYFSQVLGDPLIRWKAAANYGTSVASSGTGGTGIYSGYDVTTLIVRYPRLLAEASTGELVLHFVGLAGFLAWVTQWRDPRRLALLAAGAGAFGMIAYGVASFDPIVPLMREKLRYYATAAPFFYLATAWWVERALFRPTRHPRLVRWLQRPERVAVAAGLAGLALVLNFAETSGAPGFVRTGTDSLWVAASRIRDDADSSARPERLYTDLRTSRVGNILMSRSGSWEVIDERRRSAPGYLLLDWNRLNANARSAFSAGERTHELYRLIEQHPLVFRHLRTVSPTDVLFVGEPLQRPIVELPDTYPGDWSLHCPHAKTSRPLATTADGCPAGEKEVLIHSGGGAPWRFRPDSVLQGDRFIEVVFSGRSPGRARVRGYLQWWPPRSERGLRQPMGQVSLGPESRTFALWTYLPQDADSYRVVLRGQPDIVIESIHTYALGRDPQDRIDQEGGAWSEVVPDLRLHQLLGPLRADAQAHGRPLQIHSDLVTARAGAMMSEGAGWSWHPLPTTTADRVALGGPGYLIVDWSRTDTAATLGHAIEHGAQVLRTREENELIDVLFVDPAQPPRRALRLPGAFPRDWSRMFESSKQFDALPAAAMAEFSSSGSEKEFVYSGAGPLLKAPPLTALPGDQFVQLSGVVQSTAADPGALHIYLYYWPHGDRRPVKQLMGNVPARRDRSPFTVWTYLPPGGAWAYRLVLRATAGVAVGGVSATVLDRLDGDDPHGLGKPW